MDKDDKLQDLEVFVDRLVKEKGFENLSEEVEQQIKEDLLSRIEDRINAQIINHMPEDKMEEFDKVIETGDYEKIQQFVHENIPNLEQIMAAELLRFREIYLNK